MSIFFLIFISILLLVASFLTGFIILNQLLFHFNLNYVLEILYSSLTKRLYTISFLNNFITNEKYFYVIQVVLFIMALFFLFVSFVSIYRIAKKNLVIDLITRILFVFFLIVNLFIGTVYSTINSSIICLVLIIFEPLLVNETIIKKRLIKINKRKRNYENYINDVEIANLQNPSKSNKRNNKNNVNLTTTANLSDYYSKIAIVSLTNSLNKKTKKININKSKLNNVNTKYLNYDEDRISKIIPSTDVIIDNEFLTKENIETIVDNNKNNVEQLQSEIFELNQQLNNTSKEDSPNLVIKLVNTINSKIDTYNDLCQKNNIQDQVLQKYNFGKPERPKLKFENDHKRQNNLNKNSKKIINNNLSKNEINLITENIKIKETDSIDTSTKNLNLINDDDVLNSIELINKQNIQNQNTNKIIDTKLIAELDKDDNNGE